MADLQHHIDEGPKEEDSMAEVDHPKQDLQPH